MDQVHVIRYKVQVEGLSSRRVAREMGVSRNTVKRYLEGAEAGERQPAPRPRPKLEKVEGRLKELLESSQEWTQGKQRLTAARLWEILRGEGYEVGETLVKQYVREWRRQRREVFVPLEYPPGDMAQVDFFEVFVDLAGTRTKAFMFVMRLMHSRRDFAWLYPRQDQVCFLDGHVRAFEHFGAVPNRIVYDNLKPAVTRILRHGRELSARFQALAAHYVFEPCFARPGTGHDKGGVESRGKTIRWQHLVPIPSGESLSAMAETLLARIDEQHTRSQHAGAFTADKERMLPLPGRRFRAAARVFPGVSRQSRVKIEGAFYSVPCRWAECEIAALVGVDTVELRMPDGEDVFHERQRFGGKSIRYRHYLSELSRKPQALRQVAGKLIAELGAPYDRTWRLLVDTYGPKEAARVFASVLKVVVDEGEEVVARKLDRALASESPLPLALADAKPKPTPLASEALPESLADIVVEAGDAADYDALARGGAS